jgi:hypothetical protein
MLVNGKVAEPIDDSNHVYRQRHAHPGEGFPFKRDYKTEVRLWSSMVVERQHSLQHPLNSHPA